MSSHTIRLIHHNGSTEIVTGCEKFRYGNEVVYSKNNKLVLGSVEIAPLTSRQGRSTPRWRSN
jgi:hypothetical protein